MIIILVDDSGTACKNWHMQVYLSDQLLFFLAVAKRRERRLTRDMFHLRVWLQSRQVVIRTRNS